MADLIVGHGVAQWVLKGTAWRFEHDPGATPPTLVELAGQALGLVRPEVRRHWLDAVACVTDERVTQITDRIPGMSEVVSVFVGQVVAVNRKRVLDVC